MNKRNILFLVIPAIVVLFACSKKDETTQPVLSRITPQVVDTDLSPSALAILESYRADKPLEVAQLRDAIYSNHLPIYEKAPGAVAMKNEDLEKFYKDLGQGAPTELDRLKPHYENSLNAIFKADTEYDVSAATLAHIKETNALMCYSGTMLYAIEALAHIPLVFKRNIVVIFESGHVLIGYMELRNGEWFLTGIETTAGGKALIHYGVFKNVANQIRVVDLELFLVIDSIKYGLKNSMETANQALKITGSKYGAGEVYLLTQEPVITQVANYSPFQFGVANVNPGRTPRKPFDQINRTDLPNHVPGIPQLKSPLESEEGRVFNIYGALPYGGFDRTMVAPETVTMIRLSSLHRLATASPEHNVVVDKKYFLKGWPEMTTVSKACEYFAEEMEAPGELDPKVQMSINEFLNQYSVAPTGERSGSRVD